MSQDSMQCLPLEKWIEMQKIFKESGLRGIAGHAILETQRNLQTEGFDYGFKVYCPFGDVCNGMIAINNKEEFYELIIQCPEDNTAKIEDALKTTKIINWTKPIIIPFAPYHVIKSVQNAVKDNNIIMELLQSNTFILDKLDNKYQDISLPPGISFGLLSSDHVDLVNSTWPHRYSTSTWYFQFLINVKFGYGLFQNNNLITWVFLSESGTLLHLYTTEIYRRKGFAELLLKLLCNILLQKDVPMIAYCLKDNVHACKLYNKLGFVKSEPVAWCYLNKI